MATTEVSKTDMLIRVYSHKLCVPRYGTQIVAEEAGGAAGEVAIDCQGKQISCGNSISRRTAEIKRQRTSTRST